MFGLVSGYIFCTLQLLCVRAPLWLAMYLPNTLTYYRVCVLYLLSPGRLGSLSTVARRAVFWIIFKPGYDGLLAPDQA